MKRLLVLLVLLLPALVQIGLSDSNCALHLQTRTQRLLDGELARDQMLNTAPGGTLTLTEGVYDFGSVNVKVPGITLQGAGRDRTFLRCSFVGSIYYGCEFELSDGSILQDLTLQVVAGPGDQTELVGFGGTAAQGFDQYGNAIPASAPNNTVSNATGTLRRCNLYGGNFVLYSWSGTGNHIIAEDCYMNGTRWIATNGNSSGGTSADGWMELTRCTLFSNSKLSTHGGAEGLRAVGVVGRGGLTTATNCNITVVGDPTMTVTAGAWVDPIDSHPSTQIQIVTCKSRVNTNGGATAFDIGNTLGTITVTGGTGSNGDGTFIYQP